MIIRTLAALALTLTIASPVLAQTYPDRPIKLIVPQPPGGGFDTVARVMGERMSEILGQPIIIENRPGAGTLVGTEAAAKAPADGYTLSLGALSNIALNPGLYPKLPYDPLKDFTPVGLAVSWSYTLVARKDLPYKDLVEVVAAARVEPGKIIYGSGGSGSGQHIALAMIEKLANVKFNHVPYRGAQAAYQDLLGGRIDLFFDISSTARAQVDAGAVRALAVSSKARQAMHPNVPSVTETGVAALDMESWFGIFATAGTPAPILLKLRETFTKAIARPDVAALFAKTGGTVLQLTPARTEQLVRDDVTRWTAALREAGITAE